MFGKLTLSEIEEFIQRHLVGRLGCHADGITYIVPISYAYDGRYIYCHTFEGMKTEMLRKNPAVCFEVDEINDMANWKSVIIWGTFEEITDEKERKFAIHSLLSRSLPVTSSETTHLGAQWPFSSADTDHIEGMVFRIQAGEKTGRYEQGGASPILPG